MEWTRLVFKRPQRGQNGFVLKSFKKNKGIRLWKLLTLGIDLAKSVFQPPRGGLSWQACAAQEALAHSASFFHRQFASLPHRHGGLRWG